MPADCRKSQLSLGDDLFEYSAAWLPCLSLVFNILYWLLLPHHSHTIESGNKKKWSLMKKTKVEIILNKTEGSEMYTGISFGYSNDFEFKKKKKKIEVTFQKCSPCITGKNK